MSENNKPAGPDTPTAPNTLFAYAKAIVCAEDPDEKVRLAYKAAPLWQQGRLSRGGRSTAQTMPNRPGRPAKPELLAPRKMPKRSMSGHRGRTALLHSLAHIELNAIDLTWDLIARFQNIDMPRAYLDDFVRVGFEEAKHFKLLSTHLKTLDCAYGALPAHDGLWESAQATADDLLARIAIIPLVLEARGLDVSPAMIDKMRKNGHDDSADIITIIYEDEKHHVAFGFKWFRYLCNQRGLPLETTFHHLVRSHFRGQIKPPFNDRARAEAGLTPGFYKPLSAFGTN